MIESYTEYFLIICRSIPDYVIVDFLGTINPKIKMIEKSDIVENKTKHRTGDKPINHVENQQIVSFLINHKNVLDNFESDLLVKYFIALRNWTVHTIFPHIYENQYDDNKIIKRRFQHNFVSYLLLENGGKFLKEDGFRLPLNGNNEGSFFDKYPLSKLNQNERILLETILNEKDPIELMKVYVERLSGFVSNFESNY